ncbi:hypothetical protein [Paeniglutamicibacter sp. Y32M11]|uniref:hypothetical protein n=1 Tax=Paeniglutamicibacter sp. Y32M11 TaxID=2853258 RepID=UPI0010487301|nr:hypothetical protein [Paeniglutamicibacter sp. Y32M11]QXQ08732.1 hypothetical protein KUF55_09215 [Paeniglutamicibacter sp. Y32M11]
MTRKLELEWINSLTAHVTNRTGYAVYDVDLRTTGKITVDGEADWSFKASKLPDGEFIGLNGIKDDAGWATSPPFLEMTWRNEDFSEDNYRRVPLHRPPEHLPR